MIGAMLTSLKVVNIAVVLEASSKRSAIRLRRRVMGTRFSTRSPLASMAGAVGAADLGASVLAAGAVATGVDFKWLATSSLVTRPSRPVPETSVALTLCSLAILRAAGLTSLSPLLAGFASAAGAALAAAGAAAAFTAPSTKIAITSLLSTVSP